MGSTKAVPSHVCFETFSCLITVSLIRMKFGVYSSGLAQEKPFKTGPAIALFDQIMNHFVFRLVEQLFLSFLTLELKFYLFM